jgi:hypothetical protein
MIRGWMNAVQLSVRSCVDAVRAISYRETPHTPREALARINDSDVDSDNMAQSIDSIDDEDKTANEVKGFFAGYPEANSLADLLDTSKVYTKSNYKVLARKHVAGSRPITSFIPIGDLTDGNDIIDPGERDPDDTVCGEGGYPGMDDFDERDWYPGTGNGTGGTGESDDYPGKGNDCW